MSNPLAGLEIASPPNAGGSQRHDEVGFGKQYFVYIMTNKYNTVLYTGVTNNLERRVYEHREGIGSGFTSKYRITKLVYYEACENINLAIAREK